MKLEREEELSPCPLCDCEVRICDFIGYEVLCDCGINFAPNQPICDSREETIKAWNTRPGEPTEE